MFWYILKYSLQSVPKRIPTVAVWPLSLQYTAFATFLRFFFQAYFNQRRGSTLPSTRGMYHTSHSSRSTHSVVDSLTGALNVLGSGIQHTSVVTGRAVPGLRCGHVLVHVEYRAQRVHVHNPNLPLFRSASF